MDPSNCESTVSKLENTIVFNWTKKLKKKTIVCLLNKQFLRTNFFHWSNNLIETNEVEGKLTIILKRNEIVVF